LGRWDNENVYDYSKYLKKIWSSWWIY
jgi:hypothetical protein